MPKKDEMLTGRRTKEFGDIFTPPEVAEEMAESLRSTFRRWRALNGDKPLRMLEPSAGSGNLLWPMIKVAEDECVTLDITAVEIQADYAKHFGNKFAALTPRRPHKLTILYGDFLKEDFHKEPWVIEHRAS